MEKKEPTTLADFPLLPENEPEYPVEVLLKWSHDVYKWRNDFAASLLFIKEDAPRNGLTILDDNMEVYVRITEISGKISAYYRGKTHEVK